MCDADDWRAQARVALEDSGVGKGGGGDGGGVEARGEEGDGGGAGDVHGEPVKVKGSGQEYEGEKVAKVAEKVAAAMEVDGANGGAGDWTEKVAAAMGKKVSMAMEPRE